MKSLLPGIKNGLKNWSLSSKRPTQIPDLRNAGLALKVILVVSGLVIAVSLFQADKPEVWSSLMIRYFANLAPLLLIILLLMMVLRQWCPKWSVRRVEFVTYGLGILISNLYFGSIFLGEATTKNITYPWFLPLKISLITATIISVVFMFLYLVAFSLGPASTEARLQSLTYRIRPHFLFNSLNAILALIRRDTRKAEYALEELAELFRWLLKDSAQYITIRKEIDIVQQFIAIEKVRLGDRLMIEWDIEPTAQNAVIPALTLQPLVENAIYHGAESMINACPIVVRISLELGLVTIFVSNPFDPNYRRKKGSGIALNTIKQRLELCFDLEFKVETYTHGDIYAISLIFPFRTDLNLLPS